MKWFALLLSFWLLFLSCLPCSDTQECTVERTSISADTDHRQHQHSNELCTPFCSCSCCSTPLLCTSIPFYVFTVPDYGSLSYAIYSLPFFGEVSYAIWQPPQLS